MTSRDRRQVAVTASISLTKGRGSLKMFTVTRTISRLTSEKTQTCKVDIQVVLPAFTCRSELGTVVIRVSRVYGRGNLEIFFTSTRDMGKVRADVIRMATRNRTGGRRLLTDESTGTNRRVILIG